MPATLWPRSGSFEFEADGDPAIGAEAFFFDAGTSTPRAVYQDGDLSTAHSHPVVATGNGRWPAIYLPFGDYKYILKTAGGSTLISIDNISNDEPTDPTDTVDPTALFQTGQIIFAGANTTFPGFVRCNGRTIGSAVSSATERANADCEDLFTYLWNNYANGQAAVSGGRGASAAADWSANKAIALPDQRSAGIVGFDDMGNTAAAGMDPPIVSGSLILAGSIVGSNTHQLVTSQLPAHLHTVSITSGGQSVDHVHSVAGISTSSDGAHSHTITITDPGHDHTTNSTSRSGTKANEADTGTAGAGYMNSGTLNAGSNTTGITASSNSTGAHTHSISGNTQGVSIGHTHLVSGNTGNTGSDFGHNIVQRSIPVTVLMKL